tara:strand:+ start:340 stop:549 length:210 start_codon:yes stop_codon:yes gene_type:complete
VLLFDPQMFFPIFHSPTTFTFDVKETVFGCYFKIGGVTAWFFWLDVFDLMLFVADIVSETFDFVGALIL